MLGKVGAQDLQKFAEKIGQEGQEELQTHGSQDHFKKQWTYSSVHISDILLWAHIKMNSNFFSPWA